MDFKLTKILLKDKIQEAEKLRALRERALDSAIRDYRQAKEVLSSMEESLESVKAELRYIHKELDALNDRSI